MIGRERGGGGHRVRREGGGVDGWKLRERGRKTVMNSPTEAEQDRKRRPEDLSWGDRERERERERESARERERKRER